MKLHRNRPARNAKPAQAPFYKTGQSTFFTGIQPRLTVGKADDPQEKEADNMADQVMQKGENEVLQRQPLEEEEELLQPKIQRQEEEEAAQTKLQRQPVEEEEEELMPKLQRQEEEEEEAQPKLRAKEGTGSSAAPAGFSQTLKGSKSSGDALPGKTNAFMSQAMGADFSKVRVHTDDNAVRMNRQIRARAFTHGNHIYFNRGQFDPNSHDGQWLLAHELTHTIQQKAVRRKMIQKQDFEDHQVTGTATGYANDAVNGLGIATNAARGHLNAYGQAVQNAIGSFERYARRRISAIGEALPGAAFINSAISIALAAVPIPGAGALLRLVGEALRDAIVSEVRSQLTTAAQSITAGSDTDTLTQAVDSIAQNTSDIGTRLRDQSMRSFQNTIDPIIIALNNNDQLRPSQSEIVGMFYMAPSGNVDDYLHRFFGIPLASNLIDVEVRVYQNLISAFETQVFSETKTLRQSIYWATEATGKRSGAQEYGHRRAQREAARRRRELEQRNNQ